MWKPALSTLAGLIVVGATVSVLAAARFVAGPGIGGQIGPVSARPQPQERQLQDLTGGTGQIAGVVTSSVTGRPLRGAQVAISAPGGRQRMVETGADGKFEFTELPAGRYMLSVTRDGYEHYPRMPVQGQAGVGPTITSPQPPGTILGRVAAAPVGPPRIVVLADGQTVDSLTIALIPASVLTGCIRDENGEPLRQVSVRLFRIGRLTDGTTGKSVPDGMIPAGGATTNDLGEFRIMPTQAGEYFLGATWSASSAMRVENKRTAYAPTYYPGTANRSEAHSIRIDDGATLSGLDFSLIPSPTYRVTGMAIDSQEHPLPKVGVMIGAPSPATSLAIMRSGMVAADGTFTIEGVVPGQYELRIQTRATNADGRPLEEGRLLLTVVDRDVTGVVLQTAPLPMRR